MRRLYILLMAVVFVSINSCATKLKSSQNDVETEDHYERIVKNMTEDDVSKDGKPAQEFFVSDTLRKVIEDVLANNLDLDMARKSVDIYKEYQKEANLAGLPNINLLVGGKLDNFSKNGFYGKNGTNLEPVLGSRKIEDYSALVNVSWEVDLYRKTKNRKLITYYSRLSSEMQLHTLKTQLIASVGQTFSYIQMLNEQLRITRSNIELNDNVVKMMTVQYKQGNVTKLAVEQAQRQYYFVSAQLPDLERAKQIHENYLSRLMGKHSRSFNYGNKETIVDGTGLFVGVPSKLLARRSDVKSKEYAVEIANAELGLAKANLYPSFTISTNQGLNSMRLSEWFNPASFLSQFVGQLAQPIFNKRKNKTFINVQKLQVERSMLDFKNTYLIAVNEVSDALVKIEQIKEKQNELEKENIILQSSLKNSQLLFKNGSALYFEVLEVQKNLLQNELQIAECKGNLNTSFIQLFAALGGEQY